MGKWSSVARAAALCYPLKARDGLTSNDQTGWNVTATTQNVAWTDW